LAYSTIRRSDIHWDKAKKVRNTQYKDEDIIPVMTKKQRRGKNAEKEQKEETRKDHLKLEMVVVGRNEKRE
jgi:hypothetical protein